MRVETFDIKAARTRSGVSQMGLAHITAIPRSRLQEYESGRREPTGPDLLKISRALARFAARQAAEAQRTAEALALPTK